MKRIIAMALVAVMVVAAVAAEGQQERAFPSKTIEIIVPSGAGGSTDALARIFAQVASSLREDIEFAIVNIPGSGGQQGFEAIAAADPDGYTMGAVFTVQLPAHIVAGRARYTLDDFHFLGQVLNDPSIIVVGPDSDLESIDDLIAAAQAGSVVASVNGIGSDDHLAMMDFEAQTGVTFQMIPASGSSEQKANVMGGHVDVAFMNLSQMVAQHEAGDVKILAVLAPQPDPALPDVPSIVEEGYEVFMTGTRGFVTQSGVPADVQSYLEDLFDDVMNDPAFSQALIEANQRFTYATGAEYTAYMEQLLTGMQRTFDRNPW
jgi:tripartite-type tricarboxylate transporter receptor subunit TctC